MVLNSIKITLSCLFPLDAIGKVVNAANDSKIDFVYAISPGLDVVFTSEADVCSLKNKLKQVLYLTSFLFVNYSILLITEP